MYTIEQSRKFFAYPLNYNLLAFYQKVITFAE